ncbi:anti-sigma B factor antagonist [Jeotgalibacillus malaysiensis]|uniref:Anti-sigma factor antagonist n=1 Tax=Jeotgalibacillus malaysiensis TaxID=1508404 RepID=A0A0B5ANB3_9BACL|nr:anti-sigma factor antagonist [Jeotgalibacillus malaysiensis]AJD90152.1 anti-sigma B factor antagonist [Jeotgalibacillus malaysiensis]
MNIKVDITEQTEDYAKLEIAGEIDAYTAPVLREKTEPLSKQDNMKVVADLSEVSYMDSTGIGVFVGLFKGIKANGGHLQLIGLSDRLKRLFDITGLADIMDINPEVKGGME